MQQFNYPTTVYFGEDSLQSAAAWAANQGFKKTLLVTDQTLVSLGIAQKVSDVFTEHQVSSVTFDETHPNPIEEDTLKGAQVYITQQCDSIVALGGGSPMDVAKVVAIMATHPEPLEQYDDAKGGDKKIDGEKLPPIIAIPTTAGTGSEVGRCGVIILKSSGNKTIFFHPNLLPKVAVLAPQLTTGLPPSITAATGIDAFTHSLEAYFSPGFHPLADGIAKESLELILYSLEKAVSNGADTEVRGKMLMASLMGATAFQKGLGMIHSLAHPLSSVCGLHHGLANALVLPTCVSFLEEAELNSEQKNRIEIVEKMFLTAGYNGDQLSDICNRYFQTLGVEMGLAKHGVKREDLDLVADRAIEDVCHQTNMIPINRDDLRAVLEKAYE